MLSTTPDKCPDYLLEKVSKLPEMPTAIVNAGAPLAMQSAHLAQQHGVIEPVLVGDRRAIERIAGEIDWDISSLRVEEAKDQQTAGDLAAKLAGAGEVAALMKGDIHSDALLRSVLNRDNGLRTGAHLSHVFHMTVPASDRVLCITDGAMNVAPNVEARVEIARNAVQLMHALGNPAPKVAVLSAVEDVSESMPSSIEAAEIVKKAEDIAGAVFAGPLAFDLAVSPQAAHIKHITGPITGDADVLLVPSIETGNALFKMMVHFMSAAAAGIVMGARVPVILTSRGDSVASRLASAALSRIYSNYLESL
ncbi:MAG: bifunctional enoyl-CoA hydratase/phosphate acetyltransferase [Gammaproteobacteria bacterium]|nr:bifunctional enoyl-CoA hydratase/phosphate acetyltransferase [Gammaproteobacteria bacterium]